MNDDELRDALADALPAAPDVSGWAESARRRSRRTRGLAAGGAALVVVVAGALTIGNLPPAGIVGVPAAPVSTASATGSASTPTADPQGCRNAVTSGDIPAGALTLRLCPTGERGLQQFAPVQSLEVDGAHDVLAVLRQRPRLDGERACRADLGPAFLLIAEYSGREPEVMDLQLYGCEVVGTTSDRRTGAVEVLAAFRAALEAQRAKAPGSGVRGASLCSPRVSADRGSVMPVRFAEITGGTACGYADRTTDLAQVERELDGTSVATITADLAAHSTPWEPGSCPDPAAGQPVTALALTTRWGDVLPISPDECGDGYRYRLDGENLRWQPGPEVERLLADLVR